MKSRTKVVPGFKRLRGAATTISGIELMQRIRRGQFNRATRDARPQTHHYADRLEFGLVGSISHPIKINFLD
jgi:hypothetical protein